MRDWGEPEPPTPRPTPQPQHDPVTNPKAYTSGRIEFTDAVELLGLGFAQGNVVKYVCRFQEKGGIQDLEKARQYITMMINNYDSWYGEKSGTTADQEDQLETKP